MIPKNIISIIGTNASAEALWSHLTELASKEFDEDACLEAFSEKDMEGDMGGQQECFEQGARHQHALDMAALAKMKHEWNQDVEDFIADEEKLKAELAQAHEKLKFAEEFILRTTGCSLGVLMEEEERSS